MDNLKIKEKLKKYLFFISIVFLLLTSAHLIYSYIYFDSKEVPQKWGTISESFVWAFPNLNPLKYNIDYNAYVNHILFRSLLTYDSIENKIIWDLATCDISNLSKIECFLSDSIRWSDWENITVEDIASTYNILKETNINPTLKSALENIKITPKESSILFESATKDVNILNIFFQEILPKSIIEQIDIDKIDSSLSPENLKYSWKYKISKVDRDDTTWYTKIFLEKNNFYTLNSVYIENIILKFYNDIPTLLQQKDSINIFNDKKQLIWDSIPKLQNYKYILPQYISAFINKDRLKYPNLRNYILSNINSEWIVKALWDQNYKQIDSPFLNELKISTFSNNSTLDSMMKSLWYYKKQHYLDELSNNEYKVTENKTTSWAVEKNTKVLIKNIITKENYNSKSKLIVSPDWVDKYNFITNSDILLEWKSNKNVTEVYINDYKLENYDINSEKFYYRLSLDIWNIKLWQNDYKIYFVENWKKIEKETISFIYDKNNDNHEKNETALIKKLNDKKIEAEKQKLAEKKAEEKKSEEKKINEETKQDKDEKEKKKSEDLIQKQNLIKSLDDKFYYNKNYKAYILNLSYIEWSTQIDLAVEEVKKQLENSGIQIQINSVKLADIINQLKENTEKYDILITWINLWYFDFNLSSYFYSGQISEWKNLSKLKNSELDNILEELKSSLPIKEKKIELEKNIIKILNSEAIFKPLYSPYYSNQVIKDIEWYKLPEIITNDVYRFDSLLNAYIIKEKIINPEWKGIFWYIKYIFTNLF